MIKYLKCCFILVIFFFSNTFNAFALDINDNWKLFITSEQALIHNKAGGAGRANSYLYLGNNGWNHLGRLDLLNRGTFDDVVYEIDLDTRLTSDARLDADDASPKKIYLQRQSPETLLRVGDFYGNFSQYSLSQNLKGLIFSLEGSEENPWSFTTLGGTYKPRWEQVWKDEESELKDTYFYGTRIGREKGSLKAHFNYVFTDEFRMGGVDENTSRASTDIVHNNLLSFDWNFRPVSGLDLSGENSISKYHTTVRDNTDWGNAHRVLGRFRVKQLRTQLEYERTPSDFHTPGGSASSDRARYRIRNNYYLGEHEVFFNHTNYHDNTQETLATTTHVDSPELGFTARNLLNRRTLSSTVRIIHRRLYQEDHSQDERTDTITYSMEDRFGPFRPALEYEFRKVNPRKDENDSGEKTQAITLRGNSYHRNDIWTIRPSLAVRFEQTEDKGAAGARGTNKNLIWTGGISGDFKKDLRFNLASTISRADNYVLDADTARRTVRASLDYNIGGNRDNVLGFEYEGNSNSYSLNDTDYHEKIWKMKWTRRF